MTNSRKKKKRKRSTKTYSFLDLLELQSTGSIVSQQNAKDIHQVVQLTIESKRLILPLLIANTQGTMVSLKTVKESNTSLRSATPGQVALFVGATAGIGLHTLKEHARQSNQPKIYIVGRSDAKLTIIISDLEKINPQGTYIPIKSEFSLLKNVDAACDEFKSKEKSLHLLFMSPGYLKVTRVDNADGLEDTVSLRYYVRMRFVQQLLSPLSAPAASRVVSIQGAGKEGTMDEADLELKHRYSIHAGAVHTSTMNTLALAHLAASHPTISCLHVFPGLVITGAFDVFSEEWPSPLRFLFRRAMLPLTKFLTVGVEESGVRNLFLATSAAYPPKGVREAPDAGVALPAGLGVARGSDWEAGSGCYLLNWDGEPVGDKKLLDGYRKRDMERKIWEHTQEVFDRVLNKS